MEHRNVGRSDLSVSAIGLGCNNFGMKIEIDAARKVVHKALDLGITFFDTADVYGNAGGSETMLGQILDERRKDIVLATKFGAPMQPGTAMNASRSYILTAVESSLRRLKTDYIDLYQLHLPDPNTPLEETLRTLNDLVRQGKVRYLGCSNLAAWKVVESCWISRELGIEAFISCQDNYSLLVRDIERELVPAISAYGLGLLPYFPLASGLLTGKYKRDSAPPQGTRMADLPKLGDMFLNEKNFARIEQLEEFSSQRGHNLLKLAFGWLLAKPIVASVIAGATKPEQVESNVNAAGWRLSAEEMGEIDRITAPR